MFRNKKTSVKNTLKATLFALVLTTAGCSSNGYYPSASSSGYYYGGSPRTMGESHTPSNYYYSDPQFCNGNNALCPLLIGAAIVGAAAVLAH